MNEVKIKTEYIKLDQFLKLCGIAQTGGHAKILVQDGLVKVNNEISYERGKKLRDSDTVEINKEKFILVKK